MPATPGQLRALLEDPLKKKLIYQLWTAQALSKLGEDDPEDASPLSDLTARQLVMIDEAAEAIDRECIPYDVDELANVLMSWYYAGYYTGAYAGGRGATERGGEPRYG